MMVKNMDKKLTVIAVVAIFLTATGIILFINMVQINENNDPIRQYTYINDTLWYEPNIDERIATHNEISISLFIDDDSAEIDYPKWSISQNPNDPTRIRYALDDYLLKPVKFDFILIIKPPNTRYGFGGSYDYGDKEYSTRRSPRILVEVYGGKLGYGQGNFRLPVIISGNEGVEIYDSYSDFVCDFREEYVTIKIHWYAYATRWEAEDRLNEEYLEHLKAHWEEEDRPIEIPKTETFYIQVVHPDDWQETSEPYRSFGGKWHSPTRIGELKAGWHWEQQSTGTTFEGMPILIPVRVYDTPISVIRISINSTRGFQWEDDGWIMIEPKDDCERFIDIIKESMEAIRGKK
jgi:hypothetical protein